MTLARFCIRNPLHRQWWTSLWNRSLRLNESKETHFNSLLCMCFGFEMITNTTLRIYNFIIRIGGFFVTVVIKCKKLQHWLKMFIFRLPYSVYRLKVQYGAISHCTNKLLWYRVNAAWILTQWVTFLRSVCKHHRRRMIKLKDKERSSIVAIFFLEKTIIMSLRWRALYLDIGKYQ